MLTVNEIFQSIQGESTRAGLPCVFVRLTGVRPAVRLVRHAVRLQCWREAVRGGGRAEVESFGCRLVEMTGGEPLLQADVYPLMERLLAAGGPVLLETGGHLSPGARPGRCRHGDGREVPGQRGVAPGGPGPTSSDSGRTTR